MSKIVLPGDFVASSIRTALNGEKIVGAGLEKRCDSVFATNPGVFFEKNNRMWVVSSTKRYIPKASDKVLGVVTARAGDYFRVDLGAPDLALLNYTSFEGATKRNRPNVKIGDLIYGQVILSSKHIEPELSCVDAEGRGRGMGIICTPGIVISVTINYARHLLTTDDNFLTLLGKEIRFESTIGMNGKIWITADDHFAVLAVREAILAAETTFQSNRYLLVEKAIYNYRSNIKESICIKEEGELDESDDSIMEVS